PYETHKPKGTWLGQAIVKKIMEDHGGDLKRGDQPDDGPGAVASLMLPRHAVVPAGGAVSGGVVSLGAEMRQVSHGA
ncbi:MAG: two-component sensor histidine kinase, partial [Rhodopila sp.]|nr:two-component sensor histidine kinase [Rhodopila sp.]